MPKIHPNEAHPEWLQKSRHPPKTIVPAEPSERTRIRVREALEYLTLEPKERARIAREVRKTPSREPPACFDETVLAVCLESGHIETVTIDACDMVDGEMIAEDVFGNFLRLELTPKGRAYLAAMES